MARIATGGRIKVGIVLALAGLALLAVWGSAPRVLAAARTGHTGHHGRHGGHACPASRSFSSLPLFAHVNGADDVMVDSSGNVWVSNVGGHRVTELSPAGKVVHAFVDKQNPEGMVQLSPTTMALANQKTDRLDVFNMKTGKMKTWVQLTPNGNLGIDGIGMEPGKLLVPDSAQDKLDTVPLPPFSGGPTTVATGLGRPVDATPVGDGTLLVSVENSPGLDRVNPATGSVTPEANLVSTDDVIVSKGIAYVTNIDGGTFDAVTLSSGTSTTLVTAVSDAQGLAMRSDRSFLVADEGTGDIRVAQGC